MLVHALETVMDVMTLLPVLLLGASLIAAGGWLLANHRRKVRRARRAALGPDVLPVLAMEPGGKHRADNARALPVADLLARGGAPIRIIWPVRHAKSDNTPTTRLPRVPGNGPS
jgi:hypothetical protein